MPPAIDITGQKFGRLVAVAPTAERSGSNIKWKCICSCGNIINVSINNLRRGLTRSCGCLHRECAQRHATNIAGEKFGRLIAIRPTNKRQGRSVIWECICDCSNIALVSTNSLHSGHTKSCGCLATETRRRQGQKNKGENHGQWKGGRIKNIQGYIKIKHDGHTRADRDGYVLEHILIAEKALGKPLPRGAVIHHINCNRSDNRNENLVICENRAYHRLLHRRMEEGYHE